MGEGMMAQRLIVYEDDHSRVKIYSTAYTDLQVKEQIIKCVERHGRGSKVRSILAEDHKPT